MKCKVNLKTNPITLTIMPEYLSKDELETLKSVGQNGMVTLETLDSILKDIENEEKKKI